MSSALHDPLTSPADEVGECDRCHDTDQELWCDYQHVGDYAYCSQCWTRILAHSPLPQQEG